MTQHGDVQKFEGSKERKILFSLLRHKNYWAWENYKTKICEISAEGALFFKNNLNVSFCFSQLSILW